MNSKTKVISLRVEEAIHNELERQAEAEGMNISSLVREMVYAFVYSARHDEINDVIQVEGDSTTELLEKMEGRIKLIKRSLHKAKNYTEQLEDMEDMFDNVYISLDEALKKGAKKISELKVKA